VRIAIITGARPQFVKIAPIIHALQAANNEFVHIHSGQHYDANLSSSIFRDLDLREPDFNLEVGSGLHASQTANIMIKLEQILPKLNIGAIMVPGDTNTTLAGALTAIKMGIPIIHLEAGLRSHDWYMPEEINRILVDRISSLLIATTDTAEQNLLQESINPDVILRTGDTMVDSLHYGLEKNKTRSTPQIAFDTFILCTLHRPANVDSSRLMKQFVKIVDKSPIPIILPLHPRTRKNLIEFGLLKILEKHGNIALLPPLSYLDFLYLEQLCQGIMTDSGGIQKEAFILKKPCITLRDSTEWIETISKKANRLTHLDVDEVIRNINEIADGTFKVVENHPYGNGQAGKDIVDAILNTYFTKPKALKDPILRE